LQKGPDYQACISRAVLIIAIFGVQQVSRGIYPEEKSNSSISKDTNFWLKLNKRPFIALLEEGHDWPSDDTL
jgi:hypothetical protein